ncbi:MAG: hypothetical protein H6732_09345 [Alphaproteobacteria bacterium]|nr:hypothetical protein [Alphaproteobacteria bacterium]
MQSGDILTDDAGRAWIVDAELGRGLWGRSWGLKGEDGTLAVLKVPHGVADFPQADEPERLARACATGAAELCAELEAARFPALPPLLGTIELPDDRVGLLVPRYLETLETRLAGHAPLSEVLDVVIRVCHRLSTGAATGVIHGNLRPSNILLDATGTPVLGDPLVPALLGVRQALEAACRGRSPCHPPESRRPGVRAPASGTWDTWALALAVFRSAAEAGSAERIELPVDGLGRVGLAAIKDAAAARLAAEHANPRFAGRATSRLGAVLNRALSVEAEPSPPYRFTTTGELKDRLVEVDELIHPAVGSVSRPMLGAAAADGVFAGGEAVTFTVNVSTTSGVTAQEDLAVGVQLHDLDAGADGRVRIDNARFSVDRYPAGRWRFEFVLPDVPPGRYRVRVAFAVKDDREAPMVAEGTFQVRPRPGYVPPPDVDELPAPLTFSPRRDGEGEVRRPRPPQPILPADEADLARDTSPPMTDPGPMSMPSWAGPLTAPGIRLPPSAPPVTPAPRPALAAHGGLASAAIALAEPPMRTGASAVTRPPLRPVPLAVLPDPPSVPTAASPEADTAPGPVSFTDEEDWLRPGSPPPAAQVALHDYPSPLAMPQGTQLPTYDLDDDATAAPHPGRQVLDQAMRWLQADPWTAFFFVLTAVFLVAVLGFAILPALIERIGLGV